MDKILAQPIQHQKGSEGYLYGFADLLAVTQWNIPPWNKQP